METRLLKKIRKRYVIFLEINLFGSRFYKAYDRFDQDEVIEVHFETWIYYIVYHLFGAFQSSEIMSKHQKNKKRRRIKKEAIQKGYTEKQLLWLKKE